MVTKSVKRRKSGDENVCDYSNVLRVKNILYCIIYVASYVQYIVNIDT